jgi:hypothetical protein
MGNFFSQQNSQPKKDKIHIEPIQENNLEPVNHSDLQPVIHSDIHPVNQYVSINQPILPPLEIQPKLDEEIHDELNTEIHEPEPIIIPIMNEYLKKEIHSRFVDDQENIHEHINKHDQYINKKERKRKRNNKREKTENK